MQPLFERHENTGEQQRTGSVKSAPWHFLLEKTGHPLRVAWGALK
jgi:hypothetical protein